MSVRLGVLHRLPHLGSRLEALLQTFHFADLRAVLLDTLLHHVTHHRTWRIAVNGVGEDLFYLGEGKSKFLGRCDKPQPVSVAELVDLVTVSQVPGRFEQSDTRVVPDGEEGTSARFASADAVSIWIDYAGENFFGTSAILQLCLNW
jgi:hypothetical protein